MVDNKILHCIVSHIYQHWSIIFTLSKILRNFDKFHYILKALYMISHKKLYCFWIENTLKLPDFKYYIFALIFLFKKKNILKIYFSCYKSLVRNNQNCYCKTQKNYKNDVQEIYIKFIVNFLFNDHANYL